MNARSFFAAGIFENILGTNAELATDLVSKTTIMKWLLDRIQSKAHDENRGYAAELISILLQNNRPNRLAFGKEDGVEICLKVVAVGTEPENDDALIDVERSNTENATLLTQTRPNSWRTSSISCVRHWQSQR